MSQTPRAGSLTLAPKLTEREFMDQVTQLAEIRGWSWAHFRPAMTTKGWRTPVSGPLGKGWPDLVLVREGYVIFAELKAEGGKLTPEQELVMTYLANYDHDRSTDAYVWWPADWADIEDVLR